MISVSLLLCLITITPTEQHTEEPQINITATTPKQDTIAAAKDLLPRTSDPKESTTLGLTVVDPLNATTISINSKLVKVKRKTKNGRKNGYGRRANKQGRKKFSGRRNKQHVSTTPKFTRPLATLEAVVKNKTVELIQMVQDAEIHPGKVVQVKPDGKLSELEPNEGKPSKSRRNGARRLKSSIDTVLQLPYIYYSNGPVKPERRYHLSNPEVIDEYLRLRRMDNDGQNFIRRTANIQNTENNAADILEEAPQKLAGEDKLNYEDNPEDYVEVGKHNNVWDYQHHTGAELHVTKRVNWDDVHDSEEGITVKKTSEEVEKQEQYEGRQEESIKKVKRPYTSNKEIELERGRIEPVKISQHQPEMEDVNEQEQNNGDKSELDAENEKVKDAVKEEDVENDRYIVEDSKIVTSSYVSINDESKAGTGFKGKVYEEMGKVEEIPFYTDIVDNNNEKYTSTKTTTRKDILKPNDTNKKRKNPRPNQYDDNDEKYDQKRWSTTEAALRKKHIDYDNNDNAGGNKKIPDRENSDDYDKPLKPNASKQRLRKQDQVQSDESNDNMKKRPKKQMQIDKLPKQSQRSPKKPQRVTINSKFRSEKDKNYGRSYKQEDAYYDEDQSSKNKARKPVARGGAAGTGTKWSEEKRYPRNNDYDYKNVQYDKKSKSDKKIKNDENYRNFDYDYKSNKYEKKTNSEKINKRDQNFDYDYSNKNDKKSKSAKFDKQDRNDDYDNYDKKSKSDNKAKIDEYNYKYDMTLNLKENTHSKHNAYSKESTYTKKDPYGKEKSHFNDKPYDSYSKDNSRAKERSKDSYDDKGGRKMKDYDQQYYDESPRSTKEQLSTNKRDDYLDVGKKPREDKYLEQDYDGGSKKKEVKDDDYDGGPKTKKKKADFDDYNEDSKKNKQVFDKHSNNDWDKVGVSDKDARETRRTVRNYPAKNKIKYTTRNALWDRHGNNDWDKVGVTTRSSREGGRGNVHRSEGRSGGSGGQVFGFGRTPLLMGRHKTLYEKKK